MTTIDELVKKFDNIYPVKLGKLKMMKIDGSFEDMTVFDIDYDEASVQNKMHYAILSTFFAYPIEIRKIIYKINIISGLNRQLRKITKTKSVFPNDNSIRKMLYLASQNITKKWTQRYKNWDIVISRLVIIHNQKTA